jgi:hypothetical protein
MRWIIGRVARPSAAAALILAVTAGAGVTMASATEHAPRLNSVQATLQVRPTSGPTGTSVGVRGRGFAPSGLGCVITISFIDASGMQTILTGLPPQASFKTTLTIPEGASLGAGTVRAEQSDLEERCLFPVMVTAATFTVTEGIRLPPVAYSIEVRPVSGPAGTAIKARGLDSGLRVCSVDISFTDAAGVETLLTSTFVIDGTFRARASIPSGAALGLGTVWATQWTAGPEGCRPGGVVATASFTVTA